MMLIYWAEAYVVVSKEIGLEVDANKTRYMVIYCAGGKIEKNEMGGACGAYGGWERFAQGSDW